MGERVHAAVGPDHLRAIGHVAANFALLEHTVESFSWQLIDPRDEMLGQLITAELSFRSRVTLLSALVHYRLQGASPVAELKQLLGEATTVEQERNKIVHSLWAFGPADSPETITRFKTTAKRSEGLRHHFVQTRIVDIESVADQIDEVALRLRRMMVMLAGEDPASLTFSLNNETPQ